MFACCLTSTTTTTTMMMIWELCIDCNSWIEFGQKSYKSCNRQATDRPTARPTARQTVFEQLIVIIFKQYFILFVHICHIEFKLQLQCKLIACFHVFMLSYFPFIYFLSFNIKHIQLIADWLDFLCMPYEYTWLWPILFKLSNIVFQLP